MWCINFFCRRQQGYHHPEQVATSVVQRERKRKNKITPDPEECVQSERDKGKIMMSTSGKNMETGQELQIPEDLSDCSSKDETKPAKRTLKKTFTSLLSKIQLGRFSTDASSVTDTDSNCESSSKIHFLSICHPHIFGFLSALNFWHIFRKTRKEKFHVLCFLCRKRLYNIRWWRNYRSYLCQKQGIKILFTL